MKLIDKIDKSLISGKFFNPRTKLMDSFFILVCNWIVFQPRNKTDFSSLELGQLRLIWWLIRSRIWKLTILSLKVFSRQLSMKLVKCEDEMLILGQNYIFWGHNVIHFSTWFLQQTILSFEMPGCQSRDWNGFVATEHGVIIKFRHFSSHPDICLLWYTVLIL